MMNPSGKQIAIVATDRFEQAELVTPRDKLAGAGAGAGLGWGWAGVKVYSASVDPIRAVEVDTDPRQKVEVDTDPTQKVEVDTDPTQKVEVDTDPTQKVQVDGVFGDLDVSSIDAVRMPGGTINADTIRLDKDAQRLVEAAYAAGKVLAVICHGLWPLVNAGAAEGRRLTSYPSLAHDRQNAGATWVDEEVVVDGHLITSRNLDDLPAFVETISTALVG